MSYAKAMKHNKNIRKCRKQRNMYMGFSALAKNERRKLPWLGSAWFKKGMEAEREKYIREYQEETERLLKENPSLKLVD